MQAAAGVLLPDPAAILETLPARRIKALPGSPIREVTGFKPSEIWLIQVNKVGRRRSSAPADHSLDLIELASRHVLEQELRFIEKINTLLKRGTLIDGGYRPIEVHRIIMEHDLDDTSKLDRSVEFRQRAHVLWPGAGGAIPGEASTAALESVERAPETMKSRAVLVLESHRIVFAAVVSNLLLLVVRFFDRRDQGACPSESSRSALCAASSFSPGTGSCHKQWPRWESRRTKESRRKGFHHLAFRHRRLERTALDWGCGKNLPGTYS